MGMRSAIAGGAVVASIWAVSGQIAWNAKARSEIVRTGAGEAVAVVDGDTVDIAGRRFRLVGSDAQPGHDRAGPALRRPLKAAELVRGGVGSGLP